MFPHPVWFTIFGFPILWYSVFMTIAFFVVLIFGSIIFKKENISYFQTFLFFLWICCWGFIGARLFYVFAYFSNYIGRLWHIFAIWEGGLSSMGAFISLPLSILAFYLIIKYLRKNKDLTKYLKNLPLIKYFDTVFLLTPLGLTFIRMGCFVNGCCYGKVTDFFIKIYYLDAFRHPTQIYHVIVNFSIFLILYFALYKKKAKAGMITLYFLVLYSLARILIGTLRVHEVYIFGNVNINAFLFSLIFIISLIILIIKKSKN